MMHALCPLKLFLEPLFVWLFTFFRDVKSHHSPLSSRTSSLYP